MVRIVRLAVLLASLGPLAHGCHREEDEISNRWLVIYAAVAVLVGASYSPGPSRTDRARPKKLNAPILSNVGTSSVLSGTPLVRSK
jgi:hypothetical protein